MISSGYRLASLGIECGGGQIANAFISSRLFLGLLLVGGILLWLWVVRHYPAALICTDN